MRIPGKTFKATTGDKAVDHYHRFKEDVKLMADMGLKMCIRDSIRSCQFT